MRPNGQWLAIVLAAMALSACRAAHADSVKISIPASVTFAVTNVTVSTIGTPNPFAVSFSKDKINGSSLRISVMANAANFTPPGGTVTIPVSDVSWTTSSVVSGIGFNGTLSSSAFTSVYQSVVDAKSGSFDMTWTLGAPGAGGLRAGSHTLTLTWKLEAI